MSHAPGQVRFPDGTVYWFEYNGTTDTIWPKLYQTYAEYELNYRKYEAQIWKCKCREPRTEEVDIAVDYGNARHFKGFACRGCGVITSSLTPWDYYERGSTMGVPDVPEIPKDIQLYRLTEEVGLPDWWVK